MKRGLPISPGVAVARAFCMDHTDHGLSGQAAFPLDAAALSGEASRFDRACAAVARELDDIIERVSRQV
ncbi:MAG TPA: phosphoenolpyruvate-utilizing N-terminal domain-containing protein, partial [Gemmataceae bacterium]